MEEQVEQQLSMSDARRLAKYYGKMVQSNPDRKEDQEALSYLRCYILKNRKKKETK